MAVLEQRRPCVTPTFGKEATYWVRSTADAAGVLEAVAEAMELAGYPHRDRFGMQTALEEAVANAVKHGHRGDSSKRVRVSFCVGPEYVLAEVEDQGPGFDLASVPDPTAPENLERDCGRGLLLMRSLVSRCQFNRRGNRVTLGQHRSDD